MPKDGELRPIQIGALLPGAALRLDVRDGADSLSEVAIDGNA